MTDKVFPALDILRMGVKHAAINQHFCRQPGFLDYVCKYLSADNIPANQLLALRTLANLFSQPDGVNLIRQNHSRLLQSVLLCKGVTLKNAQIALSTVLLNSSVAANAAKDFDQKAECISAVAQLLNHNKELDDEAVFRLLSALGTLIHQDEGCQVVVQSLDLKPVLLNLKEHSESNKVLECADFLLK